MDIDMVDRARVADRGKPPRVHFTIIIWIERNAGKSTCKENPDEKRGK